MISMINEFIKLKLVFNQIIIEEPFIIKCNQWTNIIREFYNKLYTFW